ncbi:MAG: NAD(P)/FAD-dependent oxidoreductase [Oscillospiraceae bacterium]|nr:NAD(P)/FAD-dependent oxidoreductase [Oscillospiraceae bacterium]
MDTLKYKHLFSPVSVAGALFKNRIITSAMGYLDVAGSREHGYYHKPEAAAFYERRAAGGSAMVTVGSCYIDKDYGDFGDYHVFLDNPRSIFSLYDVAQAITRHGVLASAEILHCGLYSNRKTGLPSYGPVAMEDNGRPIYEMSEDYIISLIDRFAAAAATAKHCGFSAVTIHGGHGWLISQFLNPHLNTRKDSWGGSSIENRARLPVEICKAIRARVGSNFPIEMRISGSECYDGGYDISEGIALAKQLDGYADMIHVSAGSHERDEVFTVTHPDMFREEGCNSIFAAEIKKNVSISKVVTVGGFSDPELMEEIIATGQADFVAISRSLLSDPDLPAKVRTGREEEVIKCMRCLSCFSTVQTYGKFYCSINPKTGREYAEKFDIPPANKKKVLIIGGGVGGMQAALTCAQRGHEVTLCEKNSKLGGILLCEEHVPFKKNLSKYIHRQTSLIEENPSIVVKLNTKMTPKMAEAAGADVIIAALGANPDLLAIEGLTTSEGDYNKNVVSAVDAYMSPEKVGAEVIILGGGLVGVELGIYLATLGRKVTIIEMQSNLDHGGNHLHAKGLAVQIQAHGINVSLSTKALSVTSEEVICICGDERKTFTADTVIFAAGQAPRQKEAMEYAACAPEFHVLGDCIAPTNIFNATSAAYEISRTIGRYS